MGFEIDHENALMYYVEKQEKKRVGNISLRIVAEVLPPSGCPVPELKGFIIEVKQKTSGRVEIG